MSKPRGLVQAPIGPVDADGVAATSVGTIGFAIATMVMWAQRDWLNARDAGWWLWVGVAGTIIGLLALGFTLWRRSSRRRQSNSDSSNVSVSQTGSGSSSAASGRTSE